MLANLKVETDVTNATRFRLMMRKRLHTEVAPEFCTLSGNSTWGQALPANQETK
jgi:hypothetical protein